MASALGGLASAAGGMLPSILGTGNNSFRGSDYADSKNYDKNDFELGGSAKAFDQNRGQALDWANSAANRPDINANYGQSNQSRFMADQDRGSQINALDLQRQAAFGQAPSQAQMMMQQGNDQAIRGQMAAAASARGPAALANAQYNASQNAGNMAQQNVGQMGAMRANEMAQARDAYMQGATGMRGQDFSQRGMDINQANAAAQFGMQNRQLNDAASQHYRDMWQNMANQSLQGHMQRQHLLEGSHEATDKLNAGINQANAGNTWGQYDSAMGGLQGGMRGLSNQKWGGGGDGGGGGSPGGVSTAGGGDSMGGGG